MEKLKLSVPVIVEGKYDKMKLREVLDAHIITTEGFGIFNSQEKIALIRALAKDGIIVLTDSDGAGTLIRSKILSALPKDKVYNLYIPRIEGKERRKSAPSKEGTLGVEGMSSDTIRSIFERFAVRKSEFGREILKSDFYEDGLTGTRDSEKLRDMLSEKLNLPPGMTPNRLLGAVNILLDYNDYRKVMYEIKESYAKN